MVLRQYKDPLAVWYIKLSRQWCDDRRSSPNRSIKVICAAVTKQYAMTLSSPGDTARGSNRYRSNRRWVEGLISKHKGSAGCNPESTDGAPGEYEPFVECGEK